MIKSKRFENAEISAAYDKFRPVYPACVGDIITSYMRSNGCSGFEVAVDAACGTGQSTFLLSDHFLHVIGIDISETQIRQAKLKLEELDHANGNIEFKVGDAHNFPIESSSVDLLTCAMAWHWLDAEKFYAEARRVLKPGGCLAVYGHGSGVLVKDNDRVKNAFESAYAELFKFNCFAEENFHVMNKYKTVELPFSCTKRIEFDLQQKATIDQLIGLWSSMSMFRSFAEKYPENNIMQKVKEDYKASGSKCNVEEFTLPGFIIVGINT